MYADQKAQELYEEAQVCRDYAARASENTQKIWLGSAEILESAAKTIQEASDIEEDNKQRKECLRSKALEIITTALESGPNLPEGIKNKLTKLQSKLET